MPDQGDIDIHNAIVCFDPVDGALAVFASPDTDRRRDQFSHVFGACDPCWSDCASPALLGELLLHAWQAAALHGLSAAKLHEALLVVPQYRETLPPDLVPSRWRDI